MPLSFMSTKHDYLSKLRQNCWLSLKLAGLSITLQWLCSEKLPTSSLHLAKMLRTFFRLAEDRRETGVADFLLTFKAWQLSVL